MNRPGWRRSGQLTRRRPLVLGLYACSSSCWWYARIRSRLVQAGGGGGATHECGSGDLLETGGAHGLARRRGEGTTSQHFEEGMCGWVGGCLGIWERCGGGSLQMRGQLCYLAAAAKDGAKFGFRAAPLAEFELDSLPF